MAATAAGARLTAAQRRAQLAIRAAALRDLARLWRLVDVTNLAGTIPGFAPAAVAVVQARRAESARSAGSYFEQFAEAEGVVTPVRPLLAGPVDADQATGVLRGAALAGIIRARRAGFPPAAALRNGLVKVQGSATEMVLDGGRETLMRTAVADGQAAGWRRITAAEPCPWCADRSGRVYTTDDFGAHDHCACNAEPAFG